MICSWLASIFIPEYPWALLCQYPIIISSIICLILLFLEKKEVRAAYGLKFTGRKKAKSWWYVLLFFILNVFFYYRHIQLTPPYLPCSSFSFLHILHFLEKNMDGGISSSPCFKNASAQKAGWFCWAYSGACGIYPLIFSFTAPIPGLPVWYCRLSIVSVLQSFLDMVIWKQEIFGSPWWCTTSTIIWLLW